MLRSVNKASKEDKLKFIQNFLSGVLDLSTYRPPKNYTVLIEKDKAVIKHYQDNDIELSHEQYEVWKQSLSEQDLLFVIDVKDFSGKDVYVVPGDENHSPVVHVPQEGNEPLQDGNVYEWKETKSYGEPEAQDLRERIKDEPIEQPKKQARKSPKKDLTNEIQAIKVAEDIFPILPNYGKASDYGIKWKLRRN